LYGAALGLLYGPFGDLSAEDFRPGTMADRRAMGAAERVAARGILVGGLVGAVIGVVPALARQMDNPMLGAPPAIFMLATVLAGVTLGGFIGSFVGLASTDSEAV
jgi:LytS/YehU family sensor histidine kinase